MSAVPENMCPDCATHGQAILLAFTAPREGAETSQRLLPVNHVRSRLHSPFFYSGSPAIVQRCRRRRLSSRSTALHSRPLWLRFTALNSHAHRLSRAQQKKTLAIPGSKSLSRHVPREGVGVHYPGQPAILDKRNITDPFVKDERLEPR